MISKISKKFIIAITVLELGIVNTYALNNKTSSQYGELAGTYYATCPILFGDSGKTLKVEKYLTISKTKVPYLFIYKHCWRIIGKNKSWHPEHGELVITSLPREIIKFTDTKKSEAPAEGSKSTFTGKGGNKNNLYMKYGKNNRGIIFSMDQVRTKVKVDAKSCPVK